jgi:hypothetical protein
MAVATEVGSLVANVTDLRGAAAEAVTMTTVSGCWARVSLLVVRSCV